MSRRLTLAPIALLVACTGSAREHSEPRPAASARVAVATSPSEVAAVSASQP